MKNFKVIDKIADKEVQVQEEAQAALDVILSENPELKEKMEKDGISPDLRDWKKLESWDGREKN